MQERIDMVLHEAKRTYAEAVNCAKSQDRFRANALFYRLMGMESVLSLLGESAAKKAVADLIDDLMKLDKQECMGHE